METVEHERTYKKCNYSPGYSLYVLLSFNFFAFGTFSARVVPFNCIANMIKCSIVVAIWLIWIYFRLPHKYFCGFQEKLKLLIFYEVNSNHNHNWSHNNHNMRIKLIICIIHNGLLFLVLCSLCLYTQSICNTYINQSVEY